MNHNFYSKIEGFIFTLLGRRASEKYPKPQNDIINVRKVKTREIERKQTRKLP